MRTASSVTSTDSTATSEIDGNSNSSSRSTTSSTGRTVSHTALRTNHFQAAFRGPARRPTNVTPRGYSRKVSQNRNSCTNAAARRERSQTINAHRKAMCAKVHNPDPKKYDCDEYPFAASKEGGNPARGSTRIISAGDNRSAGARLGGFYKAQRVLNGDGYYVRIK
ncbi:NucA/NucB deoxyribonuclease domain-containing protein [Streptomyces sp. NPDC059832]|uniref:NucA/NucB deoxyribonuclease domain-containing protein n=1 Tax=Streptomyces sp. NPDC059832 TaxID=3346966 RepID=UPI0036486458